MRTMSTSPPPTLGSGPETVAVKSLNVVDAAVKGAEARVVSVPFWRRMAETTKFVVPALASGTWNVYDVPAISLESGSSKLYDSSDVPE